MTISTHIVEDVGMQLESFIKDKDISINQLADLLGSTYEQTRRYVRREQTPPIPIMEKLIKLSDGKVKLKDMGKKAEVKNA